MAGLAHSPSVLTEHISSYSPTYGSGPSMNVVPVEPEGPGGVERVIVGIFAGEQVATRHLVLSFPGEPRGGGAN